MNKPKLCYKYADRSVKNSSEKAISELGKLKQFDLSIGTTDNIIGGHRFVLSMFSKYFRDVTSSVPPHTMIFTRIEFPSKMVSSLLELFYESSVIIDSEDRELFESLLKQMRVGDVKRSIVTDTNRSMGAKIEMVRIGGNSDMRTVGRPVGGLPMHTGLEIRRQGGVHQMQQIQPMQPMQTNEMRSAGRMAGSLKHKQEMDKKSAIGQKIDITPARIVAENNGAAQTENGSNNGGKYMEPQMVTRQRKPTPVDPNFDEFNPSMEQTKNEAQEDSSGSEDGGDGQSDNESEMDMDSESSRNQNA